MERKQNKKGVCKLHSPSVHEDESFDYIDNDKSLLWAETKFIVNKHFVINSKSISLIRKVSLAFMRLSSIPIFFKRVH